jgi:hypothetical protein
LPAGFAFLAMVDAPWAALVLTVGAPIWSLGAGAFFLAAMALTGDAP